MKCKYCYEVLLISFYNWWKHSHPIVFILVALILSYLIEVPVILVGEIFPSLLETQFESLDRTAIHLEENGLFGSILSLCLFVPLLETWIFQYLPIKIVRKYLSNKVLAIAVSSVLFGLAHYYSVLYVITTCLTGVVLALAFIIYQDRYSGKKAFLMVAIVHGLHNLIALIAGLYV